MAYLRSFYIFKKSSSKIGVMRRKTFEWKENEPLTFGPFLTHKISQLHLLAIWRIFVLVAIEIRYRIFTLTTPTS